jgi:hypothetical protein
MITSLFDLDRTVRDATGRLARARRSLRERTSWEEPVENPLAPLRPVLGKDTLRELEGVPDPLLVPALRPHLARLILARVLWDDEVAIARAWSEPAGRVEEGVRLPVLPKEIAPAAGASLLSPRTLLAAVLADPDERRRRQIADTFARAARDHLRDPVRRHAERRAAAAAQLGVPLDVIDLPAPAAAIELAAADLIGATAALVERFAPWDRGIAVATARDAASGWPAHLSPRWVLSVFAGTDLGKGGSIEGAALPAVLGATSFARGLAAFGEAFGRAAGSAPTPFAIARPALDLRPLRIGALFGLLAGEVVFARRTLGLGGGSASAHARAFGRAWCAQGRLAAAAVRARRSFFPPRDDLDDHFCEETARAWGDPLPRELAGVLPRIAEDTPARFAAALLAALDRAQMIERFDEDWYRNPRSVEALQALASEPADPPTEERLRAGAAELGRLIQGLVGG